MLKSERYKYTSLILVVFLLFGLFPILPFNLKPLTIILPIIIGIAVFIKNKNIKFSRAFFLNSIVFFIYAFSILYSEDQHYAIKRTQTVLALVLLPLFYTLISSIKTEFKRLIKIEKYLFYSFYFSSIILSLVIYIYVYLLGFFDHEVSYGYAISYIEHHLWIFNDHPIYLSIYVGLSILMSLSLIKFNTDNKILVLLVIGNLLLFSVLVFLSRKGVILATLFSFFYYLFKILKSGKTLLVIVGVTLLFLFLFFALFSKSAQRIIELVNSNTYTKILEDEPRSSTSIRLGIYKCSLQNLRKAGLFGFGIGDTQGVLMDCYEQTSETLVKGEYNTHNQYLNFWMSFGFIGLIIFIWYLFKLFKLARSNKDYIFTSILIFYSIIMLVENILDRQNGLILFSILINYFTYKSITSQKNNEKNTLNRTLS